MWLAATAVAAGVCQVALPTAASLLSSHGWLEAFDVLIVRVCAAALLLAIAWLWAMTTWTVADVLRGRLHPSGGMVRRLVLVTCGVAIAASSIAPAGATPGSDHDRLAGLRLPDRAVGGALPHGDRATTSPAAETTPVAAPASATHPARQVVVEAGDTLWSIARDDHRPGDQWREIWIANRGVIGVDPDLILPGQRLTLPADQPSYDQRSTR